MPLHSVIVLGLAEAVVFHDKTMKYEIIFRSFAIKCGIILQLTKTGFSLSHFKPLHLAKSLKLKYDLFLQKDGKNFERL